MKQAKLLNANERKRLTAIINGKRYPTRNHTIVALGSIGRFVMNVFIRFGKT